MTTGDASIIYTLTDEAPALATRSLLPIVQAFASAASVPVETRDISLAARILAAFPEVLTADQQVPDALTELGQLASRPEANIIKLPNISASVPQLDAAIAELQAKGYALPAYPDDPQTEQEQSVKIRYDKVKGSAVNPVLREGNSDRRAPASVKAFARANPHSMGAWSPDSKTRVATMGADDFRSTELSVTLPADDIVQITFHGDDGSTYELRDAIPLLQGEVIDAAVMRKEQLVAFLQGEIAQANADDVLFSLHMKATMMKVSDPIIFGHAVRAFFEPLFDEMGEQLEAAGADANDGFGSVLAAIENLSRPDQQTAADLIQTSYRDGPAVAMVDSDKGITNLNVPSDVIIDASMPAMIRTSGQMWNAAGEQQDTLAVIPDSSYAGIYQVVIEDCIAHGAFDPTTMGTTPNVGLMAQKAEEYGSHDKTFEIASSGEVRVTNRAGDTVLHHRVAAGDIWRMCQTKDQPIRDWVKLAVLRARATGAPAVFWLDADRAHDAELIAKVRNYLGDHDTAELDIRIMAPMDAMAFTVGRARAGHDTISVTGNVLRDYLTDLFPILELGTSAKMLSIVPLMNGGGLFETGAGGSAPKHVQQFVAEDHLRWDSLGEFLALAVSFEQFATHANNGSAQVLADTLDAATGRVLQENRSPSRKVHELDNRGSHFYLALYWAQELAAQTTDQDLADRFAPLAEQLTRHEHTIVAELNDVQGPSVDIGGYYLPDEEAVSAAMRPSATFNTALDEFNAETARRASIG
ncbi:MAG: NADP-dependent isocitrate dehydrogenase [Actinobacteria bacterium]|nr:NADP-dependent isocitrate dehydrogenase [Actinomycetota bacterium]